MEDEELNRTTLFVGRKARTTRIAHALLLRQPGSPPRRLPVLEGTVNIGRDPANELVLASSEVSRRHCCVTVAGTGATLTDLGSTNGVYVDGQRVNGQVALHSGARISIGQFNLIYQRGSEEDLAEAEASERELSQAVDYVRALLPPPLREGPVRVDWRFIPSAVIGGDAFGYRWLDDRRMAMFLLDVCGHGVGSALLAVSAANVLRSATPGFDLGDPAKVLDGLNAAFQMEQHHGLFFTIWYGVYEPASRVLSYASAGHHAAYLVQAGAVRPLATQAPAIGMSPVLDVVAGDVAVMPGARLHLFSDGAFEATRADGSEVGIDRLLDLLEAAQGGVGLDHVYRELREMTDFRPFEDDLSMLDVTFL